MKKSDCTIFYGILLLAFIIVSGCTDNRISGTAGSETVNTFTVMIVDNDKKPVRGASVRVVAADSWLQKTVSNQDPTYCAAVSGANGLVSLSADSLPDAEVNICADSGSIGAFLSSYRFIDNNNGIQDTIILRTAASLQGSVDAGTALSRVSLQGTDFSADVDPVKGTYSFSSVPAGNYRIIASADSSRFTTAGDVELLEGGSLEAELRADFSGLSVDNFDGGKSLMNYLNSGLWYIIKGGDISVIFPAEREIDTLFVPLQNALVSEGAYEGRSLHLQYSAGQGTFYCIIGAEISTPEAGLSEVDTVSFMAKGNGRLTLRLHGTENNDKPQALYYIDLDTVWQHYTVTSGQFEIYDPSNETAVWNDVRQRMAWLSFLPGSEGTDFWLDEVRLEGVTLEELFARQ